MPRTLNAAALALAILLAVALCWFELSSVDIGYHVAYGNRMFETGRIVDADPFIYGATDHKFINVNWLSQIVMAGLFNRLGAAGIFSLRVGLIGFVLTCIIALMRRERASPIWIAWAIVGVALGAYERFSERPELFSYAIMSLQLWLLLRGPTHATLSLVPLSQAFWVNLHSYFLVGPLLTGACAFGALFERRLGADRPAPPGAAVQPWRRWAILIALQIAACLLNPWHWRGAVFPIQTINYLRASNAMAHDPSDTAAGPWGIVSEFQSPFGFIGFEGASRTTHAYLVLLAVAVIGALAAIRSRRMGVAMVIILLTIMSTQMRRNIAQFAIVVAPIALLAIRHWCTPAPSAVPNAALRPRRTLAFTSPIICMAICAYWLVGIWTGDFYFSERRPGRRLAAGWSDYIFPFDAVNWLNNQADIQPQLFTDLMLSSNVLPWLRSDFKVFITTNTFAYPPEQLTRAWNVGIGKEDHHSLFEQYGVNVAMLRANDATQSLITALTRDTTWALVWFDHFTVIFARRIPQHAALIAANERGPVHMDPAAWLADAPQPHTVTAFRLCEFASVPLSLHWYDRALPLIDAALRAEPNYTQPWNNLGICYAERAKGSLKAKDYDAATSALRDARRCFENALRLDPNNREARFNLDRTPVGIQR